MNNNIRLYGNRTEFDNVLQCRFAFEQVNRFKNIYQGCGQTDFLYRKALFAEYYHVPDLMIDALLNYAPHERRSPCWEQGVNPYIFHTLFDYNSYQACYEIYMYLRSSVDFQRLAVLDYGCLVSDYGFFFGMLGAKVAICDYKEYADFASFRLTKHNILHTTHYAPIPYSAITNKIELAIFGEVLEHLNNPIEMLKACVESNVSYIYTTCYPYGDDFYFNLPGHSKEAQRQAPDSLALLRAHFHEVKFEKFRRMWVRK